MSFTPRLSPARVSSAAASALPRWALFGLLAAYIGFGIFGRAPWYSDDAAGFGIMWTMSQGGLADWLLPNIAGLYVHEEGPLPFWLGAAFILAFGSWFGEPAAARLAGVPWFALATTAVWYAIYRLTRREEAQPVAFAFGGEAAPRDYARMLADIGVLLFLATIGLVVRMHETTAEPAALAFVAVALFGVAWSLERPWRGAALTGIAIGAFALSRSMPAAAWLFAGVAAALWRTQAPERRPRAVLLAGATAVAVFSVWPLAAWLAPAAARDAYFTQWWRTAYDQLSPPAWSDVLWLVKNGAWFTWPLWPLAGWTLYAWRHALRAPHVAVPGLVLLALIACALTLDPLDDSALMAAVPPLLVLAALGATTLRRAADNLMDWFSVSLFTLVVLAGAAYFIAMQTGVPPKMAASIARQIPGYRSDPGILAVGVALLTIAGWIALVRWRVAARPPMLWRGPVLAAGGLVMLWVLLTVLALPPLDFRRSYAPLARAVAIEIARTDEAMPCVLPVNFLPPHRALFAFHGPIRFALDGQDCPLLLQRDSAATRLDDAPPGPAWQLIWQGSWPPRRDESYRLYRRRSAG